MKERLFLLLFLVCAICWFGTALVVCDAEEPPARPAVIIVAAVEAVLPAEQHARYSAQPEQSDRRMEQAAENTGIEPVLPDSDANGTPLTTRKYVREAYFCFHFSDKAG